MTSSQGYKVYSQVLYVLAALVYLVLMGIGILAWSMRRSEQSKWRKTLASLLQIGTDIMFNVMYMSVLDYFLYIFDCNYTDSPVIHSYFTLNDGTPVQCFAMPNLILSAVAGITAIVFVVSTAVIQTASCELNPCAKSLLATPAATMKIKVVFTTALFIMATTMLRFLPKPEVLLMCVLAFYVFWLNFKQVCSPHPTCTCFIIMLDKQLNDTLRCLTSKPTSAISGAAFGLQSPLQPALMPTLHSIRGTSLWIKKLQWQVKLHEFVITVRSATSISTSILCSSLYSTRLCFSK